MTKILSAKTFRGIGLHTGNECSVTLTPSNNLYHTINGIKVSPDKVTETSSRTVVCGVQTVEHLMAAITLSFRGHFDIIIEGGEVPIFDGSSNDVYTWLTSSGRANESLNFFKNSKSVVSEDKSYLYLSNVFSKKTTIRVRLNNHPDPAFLTICPTGELRLFRRDYKLSESIPISVEHLLKARTYGDINTLEDLNSRGLALGANINTVRNVETGHEDFECVLHKMLDFIGDLSLLCIIPAGDYYITNPTHTKNLDFVRRLTYG